MLLAAVALFPASRRSVAPPDPIIEITRVPPNGEGTADRTDPIEGRVKGASRGQRVVLFAQSGVWWVQPFANQPFTTIQNGFPWKSSPHPGTAYAALLVDSQYFPPSTIPALPEKG